MRLLQAAPALVAALGLAACGATGGSTHTGAPAAAATRTQAPASGATATSTTTGAGAAGTSTTATVTTTVTPSTAPATPTATSTAPANGSPGAAGLCRSADLALSYLGGQGATGHGELGFALRNTGSVSCSTGGYPGIEFLDAHGGALPTTPQHTTSDFFGSLPAAPLTVAPGQSMSFRLGVSHGSGSSAACATVAGLQVIAPNDTGTLSVAIPGGAAACGPTSVSPVQPGLSAFH